jgi:hypothetical protein
LVATADRIVPGLLMFFVPRVTDIPAQETKF